MDGDARATATERMRVVPSSAEGAPVRSALIALALLKWHKMLRSKGTDRRCGRRRGEEGAVPGETRESVKCECGFCPCVFGRSASCHTATRRWQSTASFALMGAMAASARTFTVVMTL